MPDARLVSPITSANPDGAPYSIHLSRLLLTATSPAPTLAACVKCYFHLLPVTNRKKESRKSKPGGLRYLHAIFIHLLTAFVQTSLPLLLLTVLRPCFLRAPILSEYIFRI